MRLITRRHLQQAKDAYPDAAKELNAWEAIVSKARWFSFRDLRQTFGDADALDGYIIFNIRGNRYRLITVVHYCKTIRGRVTTGVIYIRSFLTHKQYDNRDNWDKEFGR
jgi:mRNA interferase HigB